MSKVCSKCGIEKDESEFYTYKSKTGKQYTRSFCKTCKVQQTRQWEANNIMRVKEYSRIYDTTKRDKEERKAKNKQWRIRNSELIKQKRKLKWQSLTKEQKLEISRSKPKLTEEAKNRSKAKRRLRAKLRRTSDPVFRTKQNLARQVRLYASKFGYVGYTNVTNIVGCTIEELHKHLGEKPEACCHIDHICPLAQAITINEVHKLFHYSNLRWLNSSTNISKGDSVTEEGLINCRLLLGREWIYE